MARASAGSRTTTAPANARAAGDGLPAPSVGALLQYWRKARHLSQLALAQEADVSPRHVCFLETGRARPSRDMVVLLADALDVPLRERNALLLAAGFAPLYTEAGLDAPELAPVRAALDAILRQQEPFPAVVLNRRWDIVQLNAAATRFFTYLTGPLPSTEPVNLLRNIFDPGGLRPYVANWDVVAESLLHRARRECVGGVPAPELRAILEELLAFPGVPARFERSNFGAALIPVVPVCFQKEGERFDFFSTVTSLGTAQDITAQEVRIECLFPVNAETERRARALATRQ